MTTLEVSGSGTFGALGQEAGVSRASSPSRLHACAPMQECEERPSEEMTAAAMAVLRRLFGDAIPDPVASIATRWGSDEYARGKPRSLVQRLPVSLAMPPTACMCPVCSF